MGNIKTTYFKCILSIVFYLVSFILQAQNKSKNVKTINGKKYYIHIVEKGQSLYGIAKTYEMDINSILAENDEAIDGLINGQELKIPFESLLPKASSVIDTNKYVYHKIQKKETIYAITKKYNLDETKLKSYNPTISSGIKEGDYLIVGEKKKKNSFTPVAVTSTITTTPLDSAKINKPKKTAYHIGLFLPFKLAQSENINIQELAKEKAAFPSTQSLAIDFYCGFKKVVESLSSKDFDITIHLFDVEERDSSKIELICKTPEFKSLDAIFGPLYSDGFKIASRYAKTLSIPAVSPLTQQNKILFNNPMVSKINPSQYTLIEGLADYSSDSLMGTANIIIVNTTTKDQPYISTFKKKYNANLVLHGKSIKDSILEVKGMAGVKSAFIPEKNNVIIVLTNNQVYLQDFITQLYVFSDKKDITLMGFNNITTIDNLDQGYLNELHFHFAAPNHINYQDSTIQKLTKQYQEFYFSDPSDYYFEAYDIANYYLTHLKAQGPSFFFNLDKNNWNGVSNGFKFYRPDPETGFENRAVYIYKYSDYRVQKLGWK